MATSARLSALVSVGFAVALAARAPLGQGGGVVALVGWSGVSLLIIGLVFGSRGSITAAAVAFVVAIAIATTLPVDPTMPLWASALLVVLMVESGTASFVLRSRPVDFTHLVGRALVAGLVAMGVTQVLTVVVGVADVNGILMRAIGVGAVMVAAGWVAWTWRRSGLSGG